MIKAYQLIHLNSYCFTLKINGVEKRVTFSGNSSEKGMFITADEGLQKALETHPAFMVKYESRPSAIYNKSKGVLGAGKAVHGTMTVEALKEQKIIKSQPATKKAEEPKKDSLNEMTFANLQLARDFFSKEPYNIPKSEMMSYDDAVSIIKEKANIVLQFKK